MFVWGIWVCRCVWVCLCVVGGVYVCVCLSMNVVVYVSFVFLCVYVYGDCVYVCECFCMWGVCCE